MDCHSRFKYVSFFALVRSQQSRIPHLYILCKLKEVLDRGRRERQREREGVFTISIKYIPNVEQGGRSYTVYCYYGWWTMYVSYTHKSSNIITSTVRCYATQLIVMCFVRMMNDNVDGNCDSLLWLIFEWEKYIEILYRDLVHQSYLLPHSRWYTVPCESIRPPWTLRPFATFQASNIKI